MAQENSTNSTSPSDYTNSQDPGTYSDLFIVVIVLMVLACVTAWYTKRNKDGEITQEKWEHYLHKGEDEYS